MICWWFSSSTTPNPKYGQSTTLTPESFASKKSTWPYSSASVRISAVRNIHAVSTLWQSVAILYSNPGYFVFSCFRMFIILADLSAFRFSFSHSRANLSMVVDSSSVIPGKVPSFWTVKWTSLYFVKSEPTRSSLSFKFTKVWAEIGSVSGTTLCSRSTFLIAEAFAFELNKTCSVTARWVGIFSMFSPRLHRINAAPSSLGAHPFVWFKFKSVSWQCSFSGICLTSTNQSQPHFTVEECRFFTGALSTKSSSSAALFVSPTDFCCSCFFEFPALEHLISRSLEDRGLSVTTLPGAVPIVNFPLLANSCNQTLTSLRLQVLKILPLYSSAAHESRPATGSQFSAPLSKSSPLFLVNFWGLLESVASSKKDSTKLPTGCISSGNSSTSITCWLLFDPDESRQPCSNSSKSISKSSVRRNSLVHLRDPIKPSKPLTAPDSRSTGIFEAWLEMLCPDIFENVRRILTFRQYTPEINFQKKSCARLGWRVHIMRARVTSTSR